MRNIYDLIIIGAGPAGLSAAIYAGRAKLRVLVIDKETIGGQIRITAEVENYPGILNISGTALMQEMHKQAERFHTEFVNAEVTGMDFEGELKSIHTTQGNFESVAVIIATGAKARTLGFQGEEEFKGRGIGYCATCDGEFFTGLDVFVIGGGFAAAEEALFLTRYAKTVKVIVREPAFTCSKTIADKVLSNEKIEVHFNTEIVSVEGESVLKKATFADNQTNKQWTYTPDDPSSTFGVFVFVGYEPISQIFKGHIQLDDRGYILTDDELRTNAIGVYAAGDIRPKRLRQLVTAVADGAAAATNSERYVSEQKEMLGLSIEQSTDSSPKSDSFFDEDLKKQVAPVMEKFENSVTVLAILDETPLSEEIQSFLSDFASISDKVHVEIVQKGASPEKEQIVQSSLYPVIAVFDHNNQFTGIQYHGVPSGHEFNSFILALYNTAGPGQQVDAALLSKIQGLDKKLNIKVGVSLSCTMCPEVVQATQFMAVKNQNIISEMIDIAKYADFKSQYNIMSVPAIIINDKDVLFGKKSLEELVNHMEALAQ